MKKSSITLMLAFALLGGFIFTTTSCKKYRLNNETTTDEDNASAQDAFDDVHSQVSDVAVKEEGVKKTAPSYYFTSAGCATITVADKNGNLLGSSSNFDTLGFPKTVTIDFGSSGCQGQDGRTRKGKIKAVFTGFIWNSGTSITITLDSYYVNDKHVEGTKVVTNQGNETWQIVVTGGKITTSDGKVVSWESTRTRKRTAGMSTPIWIFDDVYEINGSGSGTNREGRNFTMNITTALHLQLSCGSGYTPEITSGVLEIQPQDLKLRKIDFGNGSCDNQASVTVGSKTKTFALRK